MSRPVSFTVREQDGIVVAVTFPTPWGTMKTVDVRLPDDAAQRLVSEVGTLLLRRRPLTLQPGPRTVPKT
jgi:hypothetical protein